MGIYEPSGKAREYGPLAANYAHGCPHGCLYCYAAAQALRFGKTASKEAWHAMCRVNLPALEELEADAAKRANERALWDKPWGPVLLNFTHDPYPAGRDEAGVAEATRRAVEALCSAGAAVKILSKGGTFATRDFDILERDAARHFVGATFTTLDSKLAAVWEPGAALPENRALALSMAKQCGINTWASLEPILYPGQVVEMVRELSGVTDHFALGTLSGAVPAGLPDFAREGLGRGLPGAKRAVADELERLGYTQIRDGSLAPAGEKTFYFKSGLREVL